MANKLAKTGQQLANKVFFLQSLISLAVIIFFSIYLGKSAGLSALYGAVICLAPSLVFARFAFRYAGASQNQRVVRSFNQGAKLKLALTMILYVVAFAGLQAQPVPLFCAFVAATVTQWVAMFRQV